MALRALLFTSDGTSSSVLCQVLTSLSIEVEICSELLVAMERMSKQSYDVILVDWDQEQDTTVVLKLSREQKSASQALNVALVHNDKDLARALQSGANSAIKKPIHPRQAHETLSTARDLILSRQAERKEKEARLAAAQAAVTAASDEYRAEPAAPKSEPAAPKTGFVAQTAPRSALEAEEHGGEAHAAGMASSSSSSWQAARAPSALQKDERASQEASLLEQKARWNAPKATPAVNLPSVISEEPAPTQDSTGIFSSYLEEEEQEKPSDSSQFAQPRYLVFSLVACVLIAGVLYVWAPGDSYSGQLISWIHALGASKSAKPVAAVPAPPVAQEKPPRPPETTEDLTLEPESVDTAEVDPGKIQIIETKAIPKPGAQQPPAAEAQSSAPDLLPAPQAGSREPAATPALQVSEPAPWPQAPAPMAPPQPLAAQQVSVPENAPQPSEGRVGVIIPDSLKSSPSPAPASSLESTMVPEESSRALIVHRVEPEYPAQALQQRLEGAVVLQVWVAKDGTIRDLKLLKGYFALGRVAFDAVKQWRFKPYPVNGKATEFQTTVTLDFKYPTAN